MPSVEGKVSEQLSSSEGGAALEQAAGLLRDGKIDDAEAEAIGSKVGAEGAKAAGAMFGIPPAISKPIGDFVGGKLGVGLKKGIDKLAGGLKNLFGKGEPRRRLLEATDAVVVHPRLVDMQALIREAERIESGLIRSLYAFADEQGVPGERVHELYTQFGGQRLRRTARDMGYEDLLVGVTGGKEKYATKGVGRVIRSIINEGIARQENAARKAMAAIVADKTGKIVEGGAKLAKEWRRDDNKKRIAYLLVAGLAKDDAEAQRRFDTLKTRAGRGNAEAIAWLILLEEARERFRENVRERSREAVKAERRRLRSESGLPGRIVRAVPEDFKRKAVKHLRGGGGDEALRRRLRANMRAWGSSPHAIADAWLWDRRGRVDPSDVPDDWSQKIVRHIFETKPSTRWQRKMARIAREATEGTKLDGLRAVSHGVAATWAWRQEKRKRGARDTDDDEAPSELDQPKRPDTTKERERFQRAAVRMRMQRGRRRGVREPGPGEHEDPLERAKGLRWRPVSPRAARFVERVTGTSARRLLTGGDTSGLEAGGTVYAVESGDSPWSIAQKLTGNGHNFRELLDANAPPKQLTSDGANFKTLSVGERLTLPERWQTSLSTEIKKRTDEVEATQTETTTKESTEPLSPAEALTSGGTVYVVQPGDSPYLIAQKLTGNGANFRELLDANAPPKQLTSDGGNFQSLSVGERLDVPERWRQAAAAEIERRKAEAPEPRVQEEPEPVTEPTPVADDGGPDLDAQPKDPTPPPPTTTRDDADAIAAAKRILAAWAKTVGPGVPGLTDYGERPRDTGPIWTERDTFELRSFIQWWNEHRGGSLPLAGDLTQAKFEALRSWAEWAAAGGRITRTEPVETEPEPAPAPSPELRPGQPEPMKDRRPAITDRERENLWGFLRDVDRKTLDRAAAGRSISVPGQWDGPLPEDGRAFARALLAKRPENIPEMRITEAGAGRPSSRPVWPWLLTIGGLGALVYVGTDTGTRRPKRKAAA